MVERGSCAYNLCLCFLLQTVKSRTSIRSNLVTIQLPSTNREAATFVLWHLEERGPQWNSSVIHWCCELLLSLRRSAPHYPASGSLFVDSLHVEFRYGVALSFEYLGLLDRRAKRDEDV